MENILLTNEKHGKLDLSAVNDAKGEMVILQPKGLPGSTRECHRDILQHPHVETFLNARWLSYEVIGVLETSPPAANVHGVVEDKTVTEETPPAANVHGVVEDKTVTEETLPSVSENTEEATALHVPEVTDVPSNNDENSAEPTYAITNSDTTPAGPHSYEKKKKRDR